MPIITPTQFELLQPCEDLLGTLKTHPAADDCLNSNSRPPAFDCISSTTRCSHCSAVWLEISRRKSVVGPSPLSVPAFSPTRLVRESWAVSFEPAASFDVRPCWQSTPTEDPGQTGG